MDVFTQVMLDSKWSNSVGYLTSVQVRRILHGYIQSSYNRPKIITKTIKWLDLRWSSVLIIDWLIFIFDNKEDNKLNWFQQIKVQSPFDATPTFFFFL